MIQFADLLPDVPGDTDPTDHERFEKCLAAENVPGRGRFDPNRFPVGTRDIFRSRTRRVRQLISHAKAAWPDLPPIDVGLVDSTAIGAWAIGDPSQYYIAYAAATEWLLHLLFNRMLADRNVLRHIGNWQVEADVQKKLTGFVSDSPDMDVMTKSWGCAPQPRDLTRQVFANYFRNLTVDWITLHELAHILQGHVRFRKSVRYIPPLDWQTCEVYTDNWAAQTALHIIRERVARAAQMPAPFNVYARAPGEALYHWMFAAFVFCRIFGDDGLAGMRSNPGDYPPWRFRQHMMMEAVLSYVGRFSEGVFGTKDGAERQLVRSVIDAEEAICYVTGAPRSVRGLVDGSLPVRREHKAEIVRVWKGRLRERLLEFAHIPLGD